MKKRIVSVLVALLTLVLTPVAAYAIPSILNGDLETGAPGDTTISGWTAMNEPVLLGTTTIAGCPTEDTVDYDRLRDFVAEYEDNYSEPFSGTIRDYVYANRIAPGEFYESSVRILAGGTLDVPFTRESQILELYSDISSDQEGYVAHGPAAYTDAFYATPADDLRFEWAAVDNSDDYQAFGYLVNVATCETTEVIDDTGLSAPWSEVIVQIPSSGNYRFVFVVGTFDQSFGGAAGAYLYIDNVRLAPTISPIPGGSSPAPVVSEPAIGLDLRAKTGKQVAGSGIEITGVGIPDGSRWSVTLREPLIEIQAGVAPRSGNVSGTFPMPALPGPGKFTLSFKVELADGRVLELYRLLEVAADGSFVDVGANIAGSTAPSPVVNEKLAYTGVEASFLPWWATASIMVGLVFVAYSIRARRMIVNADTFEEMGKARTPWEILSTPITAPGISYTPERAHVVHTSANLGETIRELDLALSRTIVAQMDGLIRLLGKS